MNFLTQKILDLYFNQNHKKQIVSHQLESYNRFITEYIPDIINAFNPLKIVKDVGNDEISKIIYEIYFEKPYLSAPIYLKKDGNAKEMYPYEARLQNLTYASPLLVRVKQVVSYYNKVGQKIDEEIKVVDDSIIGYIPIMIGSKFCLLTKNNLPAKAMKECEYDMGGYFIINGNEKVIISQEKMCDNKVYIFEKSSSSKYSHVAEVRSMNQKNKITYALYVRYQSKDSISGTIKVKVPHIQEDIPLFILFRALGIETDKQIIKYILLSECDDKYIELLMPSILDENQYRTKEECYEYLAKLFTNKIKKINKKQTNKEFFDEVVYPYIEQFLNKVIFPHIGESNERKSYYLGYIVKSLLDSILQKRGYDDRDSYANKRIETPGVLMSQLFRQLYQKMLKDVRNITLKEINNPTHEININKLIKSSTIENGFKYALATGNWNVKTGNISSGRIGVAQVLNRMNYTAMLSHLRRVNTPVDKTGKLVKPRQLHSTQSFYLCPAETPEGQSVGVVKNLSLSSNLTIYSNPEPIIDFLSDFDYVQQIDNLEPSKIQNQTKVFINGDWLFITEEPFKIVDFLKSLRKEIKIDIETSIFFDLDTNEIKIYTDGGRCIRPLFIVDNNKLNIDDTLVKKYNSWKDLVRNNIIEYLDVEEIQSSLICMNQSELNKESYSHCELHPSLMLGVCASLIPFSDHNQSPRNAYYSSMCKQALGVYCSNHLDRMDTLAHILSHPQKPLVKTQYSKILNYDNLPTGQNIIVAFGCYSGFNQEDSVIVNQSAIDRGLLRTFFYRTYKDEEKKNSTTLSEEKFCNPKNIDGITGLKYGDYDKLEDNGVVKPGTYVGPDDIIIGKASPLVTNTTRQNKQIVYKDNSTSLRSNESGIVDKVVITHNQDGYKLVKVKVRSERIPTVGDKFCLDNTHDVLTDKGWINITELTMNHKIAALNNGILEYQSPINVYKVKYDGKMYKLKSQQVELTTTTDHKMWVKKRSSDKYEAVRAIDIYKKRVRFKKNAINNKQNIEYFELNENKIPMNEFLSFLGIWYAEGWSSIYYRKDRNQYDYRIVIDTHKERVRSELNRVLPKLGFKICKNKNKTRYFIYNKNLTIYLNKLSIGAINKTLPDFVWNLSQSQSRLLLKGMMLGDGYFSKQNTWIYYTSSEKLKDDVQRLALHCGWSANIKLRRQKNSIYKINGREGTTNANSYSVHIIKSKNEPQINHGHCYDQNGQFEEIIDFNDYVYCCEIPSHVFYVRKNGKPVWTHNCSRHG